ncbi:MAG: CARDB domain-containing protein [Candidatus Kariarchaeaceae archaeon]
MKTKIFTLTLIAVFLVVGFLPTRALAGAYETSFSTSITYQNVDSSATTALKIQFYDSPTDTTPIEITRPNLAAGAGTSVFIGGLGQISSGFQGTAVLISDKQLVATLVQLPQGSATVKNRPLSNGFSSGTPKSLIATVLKNAFSSGQYTVFSVQNTGSSTNVTIDFYNTSATKVHTINQTLASGAGYFVDTGKISQLGSSFNGSVVIDGGGGSIVSSALELDSGSSTGAKAFEGVGSGAKTFFMPSALCNFGGRNQNTNFAVQNSDLGQSTQVTVLYSNGKSETKTVQPGSKQSFNTCNAGTGNGFIGSAKVTSATTDIIAVGKASGGGLTTAYVGFPAGSGSEDLALPYVRWATDSNFFSGKQQRVNIAIQNIGSTTVTGNILVKYVDRNGVVVGTHTITTNLASGAKANSNATNAGLSEFGVYNNGTQFGGGVIIDGPPGSQLAAIARVATYVTATNAIVGEDYNGIPFTP